MPSISLPQLPLPTLETIGEPELTALPDRSAAILRMLSGMLEREDGQRWTLALVGAEFGIGKSRVAAIRSDGLRLIRVERERQRGLR